MSDGTDDVGWNRADEQSAADEVTVEQYEADGGVVLFDAENPLAWVQASRTVRLREQV